MKRPRRRPLTVRTGKGHNIDFNVELGQRNAEFNRGALTPLRHVFRWGDAVTCVPARRTDIIHSFNAIPLTGKPHVITFEDYLPRTPEDRRVAIAERALRPLLLRRQCVAVLAMSDYAVRQFRRQNRDFAQLPGIEQKLEVLYPAVPRRLQQPKRRADVLRLLFVGNDFMRKGVGALARAHAELRRRRIPVETTVVSSFSWRRDDYIGPPSEEALTDEKRLLRQDGLTCLTGLSNQRVLELMDGATFFILPTLHDTFGYVTLEALAGATPVIATATCALPEVVEDGVSGYLLPLENEPEVGKWTWTYRNDEPGYVAAYLDAVERLGRDLADRLSEFWEAASNDVYEEMSAAALSRAETRFGTPRARARLEDLYEQCARLAEQGS